MTSGGSRAAPGLSTGLPPMIVVMVGRVPPATFSTVPQEESAFAVLRDGAPQSWGREPA